MFSIRNVSRDKYDVTDVIYFEQIKNRLFLILELGTI